MNIQTIQKAASFLWPPFWLVFSVSAVSLVVFVVWIHNDPWFPLYKGRLQPVVVRPARVGPGSVLVAPGYSEAFDYLRPRFQRRVNLYTGVWITAMVSTLLATVQSLVGRRSGRTILAWLAVTGLIAAWGSFFAGYERLRDRGFRSHVTGHIDEMNELAEVLNQHRQGWPREPIKTAFGEYVSDAVAYPNAAALRADWWESEVPMLVLRLNDGGLLFVPPLPTRFYVEWHPEDARPSVDHIPQNSAPIGRPLQSIKQIEQIEANWFLTEYGSN